MLPHVVRFLTESWGLKLAALGLAILLWLAVTANEPERALFRNVPVEVDLRDPDWRLERMEPAAISVTVQGPRGELVSLSGNQPRIILPIERVFDTVASQVVPPQWIQFPPEIRETRVLGLRPDTVRLYYQRLETVTLPVDVRLEGRLPDSMALSLPIGTNPSAVDVRGPAEILEGIDSVPLLPVDLSGLTSTTNMLVSVDTTRFEGLVFDPAEVNVVLRVVPADSQLSPPGDTARRRAPF